MTAREVMAAQKSKNNYMMVLVRDHKTTSTHGSAPIVMHMRVYQLLMRYSEPPYTPVHIIPYHHIGAIYLMRYLDTKAGADYVFTTRTGERITHIATELEKLGEHFGKKFAITPTLIRKQVARAVSQVGTEADVRSTARYMTHSSEIHGSAYQQKEKTDQCVDR